MGHIGMCNPKPQPLPRLALLFAGGVILVYLMNEIKMLLLLLFSAIFCHKQVISFCLFVHFIRVWFLDSSFELGILYYFFIIINETFNKSPS